MSRIVKMAQLGKRVFAQLGLHRLVEPANPLLMRISFLSKQSEWCSRHPAPIHDADVPGSGHEKRYELYRRLMRSENLEGAIDYFEFGVGYGNSFEWWVENNQHPSSRFFGFDTFTGLPEKWGVYEEGAFSTGGTPPPVGDERCTFEAGLFQDTLPAFLREHTEEAEPTTRRRVFHLDADLYNSTLFVLTRLAPVFRAGDLLLFDQFGVPTHEFRAFTDFVSAYRQDYEVLAAFNNYLKVAIELR